MSSLDWDRLYTKAEAADALYADLGVKVPAALGVRDLETADFRRIYLGFVRELVSYGDLKETGGKLEGVNLARVVQNLAACTPLRDIASSYPDPVFARRICVNEMRPMIVYIGGYAWVKNSDKKVFEEKVALAYQRRLDRIAAKKTALEEKRKGRIRRDFSVAEECQRVLRVAADSDPAEGEKISAAYRQALYKILLRNGLGDAYRKILRKYE